MPTGGASLQLSQGVPRHPCLDRFVELVGFVGACESGNVINDVHRSVDAKKMGARVAPGVYDAKTLRNLVGPEAVNQLREVVRLCQLTEKLTVPTRMPRPPPVKDFYGRFDPYGILRDLGTGNAAKADDSGVETVGYEDYLEPAPDVKMDVRPIASYADDVDIREDATSSFMAYTSSYNNFEAQGDAMHVYPDQEYLVEKKISVKREDGFFQCGDYVDKDCPEGEAVSPGYKALLQVRKRANTYTPLSKMVTESACSSIGDRIVNHRAWEVLEKDAIVTYKYNGRRVSFRQEGKDAYLIDSGCAIKYRAKHRDRLDLEFELVGSRLILLRVNRVGGIRPYDTYQSMTEFHDMAALDIGGFSPFEVPELFEEKQYQLYLADKTVDGKVFRKHGQQGIIKHHMSLDFRTPLDGDAIRHELKEQGFEMGGLVLGPGLPVEEYEFKKNEKDRTVMVEHKTQRSPYKRVDNYKDICQINWPTTDRKPAGLEQLGIQPRYHDDRGPVRA